MVVGARQAGLGISETDLLGFSHTISLEFTERTFPVSASSVGENALWMPEVRGKWPDWFKLIEWQQSFGIIF